MFQMMPEVILQQFFLFNSSWSLAHKVAVRTHDPGLITNFVAFLSFLFLNGCSDHPRTKDAVETDE